MEELNIIRSGTEAGQLLGRQKGCSDVGARREAEDIVIGIADVGNISNPDDNILCYCIVRTWQALDINMYTT